MEKDLRFGEKAEQLVRQVYQNIYSKHPYYKNVKDVVEMTDYFKYFDAILAFDDGQVWTIEVKHDRLYEKTGNIVFEFLYRNRPAGIFASRADRVMVVCGEDAYELNRLDLIDWLSDGDYQVVKGGDDDQSTMFLVPLDKFKSWACVNWTRIKTNQLG